MAAITSPNLNCRKKMTRVHGEGHPPAYLCLHCGQEFHPLRLSPVDVSRILEIEEKVEKERGRRVWTPRDQDWR